MSGEWQIPDLNLTTEDTEKSREHRGRNVQTSKIAAYFSMRRLCLCDRSTLGLTGGLCSLSFGLRKGDEALELVARGAGIDRFSRDLNAVGEIGRMPCGDQRG